MKPRTPQTRTPSSGFSLMELVIVLLILVTIAGIALPRLGQVSERANDTRRIADLEAVEKALELYKADHGGYPEVKGWSGDPDKYGGKGYGADGYIPGLVPDYIQMLPRDPNRQYPDSGKGYIYKSDGKEYKLLAHKTPMSYPTDHRFYDPRRSTWAYQVSSKGGLDW